MFRKEEYLLVEDIAKELGCTQQNIYQSIWKGCLRSIKYDGKRWVKREWLEEWRGNWRSKQHSWYQGKPTFDETKGEYSVKMVAKIINCTEANIYYLLRTGQLACSRKGTYVVIHKDDLEEYVGQKEKRRYA